jgi:hypothetical protein
MLHDVDGALRMSWQGTELLRYVYRPTEARWESPRPYFHPVRTLAGDLVSLYRPHDHVWHKGIAWSLSNVGEENFWGGPSFVKDRGYVQRPNHGEMRHLRFDAVDTDDEAVRVDETLAWRTESGREVIAERRRFAVAVHRAAGAWQLTFVTAMRNISGATIPIGSPTTEGRDNAGYSGLFWRGPRSFSDGLVLMPGAIGGEDLMGCRGPWLAYIGRHDGTGRASTLVFRDDPANVGHPNRWFVRGTAFAGVCPAPFFDRVHDLEDGATLRLRYDVMVVDGEADASACERFATRAGELEIGDDSA